VVGLLPVRVPRRKRKKRARPPMLSHPSSWICRCRWARVSLSPSLTLSAAHPCIAYPWRTFLLSSPPNWRGKKSNRTSNQQHPQRPATTSTAPLPAATFRWYVGFLFGYLPVFGTDLEKFCQRIRVWETNVYRARTGARRLAVCVVAVVAVPSGATWLCVVVGRTCLCHAQSRGGGRGRALGRA